MYPNFEYENGKLTCDGVELSDLAEEFGTPYYVYSQSLIESNFKAFDRGLEGTKHLICYSVKANSNLSILKLLFDMGAGADIVSGGELYRVLQAGGDPQKVVFSGVGKTRQEMRDALDAGILAFNIESSEELAALSEVASSIDKVAPVSLRINPNVDAKTHPYISTGLKKNKFGVPAEKAAAIYKQAGELPGIEVVGIDCHIGSQLTETQPFADAVKLVAELTNDLKEQGHDIQHVDIGGGLGIDYGNLEGDLPSPEDYGKTVTEALAPLANQGVQIICEPGRSIVGITGALVTKVLYRKETTEKHFTIVDAAFNDLLRPSFYQAYHPMMPVEQSDKPLLTTDVVGPICESGDFLAKDRELPALEQGDLLWVGAAGAYGFTMASNYNTRPRACEILCKNGGARVIRKRETYKELVAPEKL